LHEAVTCGRTVQRSISHPGILPPLIPAITACSGIHSLLSCYSTSRDLSSSNPAVSGQDYISKQQTVIMEENQTSITVDVVIKADSNPETDEQFLVNITDVW